MRSETDGTGPVGVPHDDHARNAAIRSALGVRGPWPLAAALVTAAGLGLAIGLTLSLLVAVFAEGARG